MRVGQHRFRPRLAALVLLLLPACLCVALGFWQLERADGKRRLAAELAYRAEASPLVIGDAPVDPEATRYRRVHATGRLEAEGQIYIESRRDAGRLGFHVITPLHVTGSERRVLVNRGWVAEIPAPVPEGEVTVYGIADVPSAPALALHGDVGAAKGWGTRWPYLTLPLYAAFRPAPLHGVIVLQDPADSNGFARHWPRELPKEGMHLGYALQWFAFAAIAFALFVRLSLAREHEPGEGRR